MAKKVPFVTKEQLEKIVEQFPTPFHLYDEAGIRRTARLVNKAPGTRASRSTSQLRLRRTRTC